MVQYENEEFITSTMPVDGILVVDVNLQGILELAPHTERFKNAFPYTYKKYMEKVIKKELAVGEVLWYKEDDYTIALIVTAERILGRYKDDAELVQIYTEEAITNLLEQVADETLLFGMVNRFLGYTGDAIVYLNKKLTTQNVYMYRR